MSDIPTIRTWRTAPSVIAECPECPDCGFMVDVVGTSACDNARARAKTHAQTTGHTVRVERSFATYFESLPSLADAQGAPMTMPRGALILGCRDCPHTPTCGPGLCNRRDMPDAPHRDEPRELERCEVGIDCSACPAVAGVACRMGLGGVMQRPDAHDARRIDYDVLIHAPRFWGAQLLASCLWDAWHSSVMTDAPLIEYTQAALARAQSKGMSIYRWVEENRLSATALTGNGSEER